MTILPAARRRPDRRVQTEKFDDLSDGQCPSGYGAIQMIRKSLRLAAVLSVLAGVAAAQTFTAGSIEISKPWARATPKGAQIGGAYMSITNKGADADRLIGGTSPVAGQIEVHQMSMNNGVMTMRPVAGGLEIKAGQTVEFKPESFHLMLMGLKQPLMAGERLKATLEFAKAGKVEVEYPIEAVGAQGPAAAMPGMPGMPHGH
jgi:copper(I)-binding protein